MRPPSSLPSIPMCFVTPLVCALTLMGLFAFHLVMPPIVIGVHPHDAKSYVQEGALSFITSHLGDSLCVAVGECGLDFNRNFSPPGVQEIVFDRQVSGGRGNEIHFSIA